MLTEKSQSQKKVDEFVGLLKYYGIYQPEELYKIVCPFHNDRNASLQINIPKAFFFCYAECGAKGSTLELYKSYYKLQHPNKEIPSDVKCWVEIKRILKNPKLTNIDNIYSTYTTLPFVEKVSYKEGLSQGRSYYYNLPTPNWFRPSLNSVVEEETRLCKQYMANRGFKPIILKQAGAKPSLNKYYPIVIPLLENGKFRGYVMRTFDPVVEQQRKYMYGRGFKRERTLPGEFGTKIHTSSVVIVEGYLDKLKGNQIGIKSIAAILGWKVSSTQVEILKKAKIKTIICATDNDEAGNKGYRYFKRIADVHGFKVVRLHFPKGIKDMGDIKQGSKEAELILTQLAKYDVLKTKEK